MCTIFFYFISLNSRFVLGRRWQILLGSTSGESGVYVWWSKGNLRGKTWIQIRNFPILNQYPNPFETNAKSFFLRWRYTKSWFSFRKFNLWLFLINRNLGRFEESPASYTDKQNSFHWNNGGFLGWWHSIRFWHGKFHSH